MRDDITVSMALAAVEAAERGVATRERGKPGGPGIPPMPSSQSLSPRVRAQIAAEAAEYDAMVAATRERFGLKAEGKRLKAEVEALKV